MGGGLGKAYYLSRAPGQYARTRWLQKSKTFEFEGSQQVAANDKPPQRGPCRGSSWGGAGFPEPTPYHGLVAGEAARTRYAWKRPPKVKYAGAMKKPPLEGRPTGALGGAIAKCWGSRDRREKLAMARELSSPRCRSGQAYRSHGPGWCRGLRGLVISSRANSEGVHASSAPSHMA
jgi:hypothetical protein